MIIMANVKETRKSCYVITQHRQQANISTLSGIRLPARRDVKIGEDAVCDLVYGVGVTVEGKGLIQ